MPQDVSYQLDEATVQWIAQDIVYFLNQARTEFEDTPEQPGNHVQNRFARTAILLTAFYLESTSKRFADCPPDPENDWRSTDFTSLNGGLPAPLARFRAVHKHYLGRDLTIELNKVRDIFLLRNKVLAYPKGRSTESVDNDGSRTGSFTYYSKGSSFPKIASQFGSEHAEEVLIDTVTFVDRFHNLVADKIGHEYERVVRDTRRALSTLTVGCPQSRKSEND